MVERQQLAVKPGGLTLDDLQILHVGGVELCLDPSAWGDIAASAAVVRRAAQGDAAVYGVNTGFGKLASTRIDAADLATLQLNLIRSHSVGVGAPLPAPVLRLMLALKAASLARGYSGVRPEVVRALLAVHDAGLVPFVPCQGSVGASGDLAPLAHLTMALIGEGEFVEFDSASPTISVRRPAADVLRLNGIEPLVLQAKEGLALINGTQVSTAIALHALLSFEPVLEAALLVGALTVDAARGSDGPFEARIHELRGQPGQIDVAQYYRRLLSGSAIRKSHMDGDDRVQDPYSLRCQPQVVGACLDQLRHAALVLVREANAVTDNPLVFADKADDEGHERERSDAIALGEAEAGRPPGPDKADDERHERELSNRIALGEAEAGRPPGRPKAGRAPSGGSDQRERGGTILSGGNFHAEPVALACDAMAIAIAEVGAIAERRIAMLIDAGVSRLPPFLTADAGLNSGFMIAHVTAASLASENKSMAHPASVDSLPTSANQEDHVSMATFAARRLLPMIDNTAHILGIELLAAAQGIEFLRPLRSSIPLENAFSRLREVVPAMHHDRYIAPDIAQATRLVSDGSLARILRTLPDLPVLWFPA